MTQQLTAEELDRDRLRELAELADEAGVLTITVGHDPSRPDESRTAELSVKSGLRDAVANCDGELRERLEARIEELEGELEDLVDPTTFGRGRVLVTSLREGAEVRVARLQTPLAHKVVVAEHAWIRPLAKAWAQHRPVRVLQVDTDGLDVLDWSLGRVVERWDREVSFGDAQMADVKSGPAKSAHQRGLVNRERFEDRLDANRERILRDAVDNAIKGAKERGIERLLVFGQPKVRDFVAPALEDCGLDVWVDDRDLGNSSDDVVAKAVEEHVLEAYVRESEDLVEEVLDRTAAGGQAVTGLAGVVAALNEGRVDTLVVSTEADVRGYVTEDGLLSVNPGPDAERDPEPFLVDRTVARALLTDAHIVPIPDEQAARFGDEGIGALLRW